MAENRPAVENSRARAAPYSIAVSEGSKGISLPMLWRWFAHASHVADHRPGFRFFVEFVFKFHYLLPPQLLMLD